MKFKIGDTIQVTLGKDTGKTGAITKVIPAKAAIVVKGINQYKRHLKPQEGFEGGIVTRERPINVAKVAIICPTCHKLTRAGYQLETQGNKIRICKKCSSNLDLKPVKAKSKKK